MKNSSMEYPRWKSDVLIIILHAPQSSEPRKIMHKITYIYIIAQLFRNRTSLPYYFYLNITNLSVAIRNNWV